MGVWEKKAGRAWGGHARLGRTYCWRVPNLGGTEGLVRGWLLVGEGETVTSMESSSRKSSLDSESTRTCSPLLAASTATPPPAPVAAPIAAPFPPPEMAPIAAPIAAPRPAVLAVLVACEAPVLVYV